MIKRAIISTLFLCIAVSALHAQPVYERHTSEIYTYLSRMAQKGIIVFNDLIQPLSKDYLSSMLDSVAAHEDRLSVVEKKELNFYHREFTEGLRKRLLSAAGDGFTFQADPVFTGSYTGGSGKSFTSSSSGINFWGRLGKHIGYQFSFQDVNESGTGIDTSGKTLESGAATGVVRQNAFMVNKQNYTEMRVGIQYAFKHGSISVGQDYLTWGYGETGKLVLSDKAPVYPYIRLDYQPLPWLRFNYTHAWLSSNLVDSERSYTIPSGIFGGIRTVFIQKFMASHSIDITLKKGLTFSAGESVIYNDHLNIGYLIPIMFFKAFDNTSGHSGIDQGSNGQFFFQLSSRNQLKNTHLYGTLFIDEIKIGAITDKTKQRNQLGYALGATITDFGLPYLTLGAEYTRIRPFVYRNFLPAQNYTSQDYLLGDWMGSNADRVAVFAKYTVMPRLKVSAKYSHIRKGGAGTLQQQYEQQPQPAFLFDFQQRSDEVVMNASYEYTYRFILQTFYRRFDRINTFSLGFSYGL